MRYAKKQDSTPAPSITEQSALSEIVPISQHDDQLFVSAILLHRKLKVSTEFRHWIKRRIGRYGFEEGLDFRSNLTESTGGRRSKDYLLTLDTAKEFAMLEENEIGRNIRRYFIAIEKRYRDWIGFILPRLRIDYDLFGKREGYIYVELLEKCQMSTKSGSRRARVRKNPQEFWHNGRGELCVSEAYGRVIMTNAIARRLNMETKQKRLDFQQSQNLLNEGGGHA